MTMLTACNQDAQNFIMRHGKPNKHRKKRIIESIEQSVIASGVSFERLFPAKSKKLAVLDEIIFYLSGSGICKVGVEKLAKKVGCSPRTVKSAVASLKETNQVVVARLAGGNAGKYIFVYKNHPNFNPILREVFFIDSLPESDVIAPPVARHVAPLQNAVSLEAVNVEGNKTNSNSFISSISKQEKDIIQNAIENDVQDSRENQAETRRKLQQYHANEFQLMLFDEIMAFPYPESIKSVAGTIALRVGIECDAKKVTQARTLLKNMALNMADNVQITHVVAVFTEGMSSKRYLSKKDPETALKQPQRTSKVKFYNWLEDRN